MLSSGLVPELQLTPTQIEQVAESTDEFSFAYLKELILSSMMNWIKLEGSRTMAELMVEQTDSLRQQMQTPEPEAPNGVPQMFGGGRKKRFMRMPF
jgi:hypothetical protein